MLKMRNKITTLAVFVVCLFTCSTANAGFIVNGNSVGVLSLTESFEDFYNYDGSSNTGLELNNSVVLFIAEYLGEFALFGLVDGTAATGDFTGGRLGIEITENISSIGSLLVIDEPADLKTQTTNQYSFDFRWGSQFNDGFVLALMKTESFELDLDMVFSPNLSSAKFIDFGGTEPSLIDLGSESTISRVSAPGHLIILAFTVFVLVASGRKTRLK